MIRYSIFIVALIALILTSGCSSSSTTDTATSQKSFCWEVVAEDSTVYILGSIHMASPDLYPLAKSIETAFENTSIIAAEFDVANMNDADILALTMEKAQYPKGENLYSNIPNDLYYKADEVLEDLGADILLFNTFEPWAVALEIEALQLIHYGYTSDNGIDMYFLNKAHDEGKPVVELESARFQIELFDSFSKEQQLFLLKDTVTNPLTKKELEQMFKAWEEGDTNAMEKLTTEDISDSPELEVIYRKMVDERNLSMTEKIVNYLEDEKDYFVVVGAGHLIGENGIINLLKNKGYWPIQL